MRTPKKTNHQKFLMFSLKVLKNVRRMGGIEKREAR